MKMGFKELRGALFAAIVGVVATIGMAKASGFLTNGLPTVGIASGYTNLASNATLAVDTNLASGQNPQTVSATAFQIAAASSELIANRATSTAGAATLNTAGGLVTTEALTTAVGSSYTFTLTDSTIVLGTVPQIQVKSGTNTASTLTLTSEVVSSGSVVFTFVNSGAAALNGTMLLAFHI